MVELVVFQLVVRIQNEYQLFLLDASVVNFRCSTTFSMEGITVMFGVTLLQKFAVLFDLLNI
jgi:hypothetical protein